MSNWMYFLCMVVVCFTAYKVSGPLLGKLLFRRYYFDNEFEQYRDRIFNEYRLTMNIEGVDRHIYHYCTHAEPIPVHCDDGTMIHTPWLGFLIREETCGAPGEYVRLAVSRVVRGIRPQHREDLQKDEYVQGWLVRNGVYAVTDNIVAVTDLPALYG